MFREKTHTNTLHEHFFFKNNQVFLILQFFGLEMFSVLPEGHQCSPMVDFSVFFCPKLVASKELANPIIIICHQKIKFTQKTRRETTERRTLPDDVTQVQLVGYLLASLRVSFGLARKHELFKTTCADLIATRIWFLLYNCISSVPVKSNKYFL